MQLLINKNNIMILGVSEWLSGKLGWDVKMIRIAFVVGVLFAGVGLGLYLILWIVKMFSK
ncbi:PspC domain-containing protein [uncultured Draconibacterium sp.]|uniref:PspC domain-containing protein n=1 Tax=uncultured Draconibacterium sp. TaxID=1573823 RepID=UPI0029C60953